LNKNPLEWKNYIPMKRSRSFFSGIVFKEFVYVFGGLQV
jgi:hypothetical protein